MGRTLAILATVALTSGIYAFAGLHHHQKAKMVSWLIFIVSSAALAAALLTGYFRFVLMEIPFIGGSG